MKFLFCKWKIIILAILTVLIMTSCGDGDIQLKVSSSEESAEIESAISDSITPDNFWYSIVFTYPPTVAGENMKYIEVERTSSPYYSNEQWTGHNEYILFDDSHFQSAILYDPPTLFYRNNEYWLDRGDAPIPPITVDLTAIGIAEIMPYPIMVRRGNQTICAVKMNDDSDAVYSFSLNIDGGNPVRMMDEKLERVYCPHYNPYYLTSKNGKYYVNAYFNGTDIYHRYSTNLLVTVL